MHQSRTHRARFRSLTLPAALAAVLLLAGCASYQGPTGPGTEDPDSKMGQGGTKTPPVTPGSHEATLTMAGQSFTFSPTVCMIGDEDVLVSGPGVDDDSKEPAYLDIDLVATGSLREGGARVDLGTDQQFSSSDDFYSAQIGSGEEYTIMDDGGTFVLEGIFRANGATSIGPGTFRIDCG